ncbi:MAG: restriction endonuclease [Bacteroidetes bacterium]|nr:restriction endonuclease [Bacteroidota bacterium]
MNNRIGCWGFILICGLLGLLISVFEAIGNFISDNSTDVLIAFIFIAVLIIIVWRYKMSLASIKVKEQKIAEKLRLENQYNYFKEIIANNSLYIDKFKIIAERKVFYSDDYGDEQINSEALENEVEVVLEKMNWFRPQYNDDENLSIKTMLTDYLTTRLYDYHGYNKKGITNTEFDSMTGTEFEIHVSKVLECHNYIVTHSGKSGDQGADLIIEKDGEKIIVQAKRYSGSVGNKAVQEAIGAVGFYDCDKGWVITNSTFTKSAEALAKKNNITLIDGYELQRSFLFKTEVRNSLSTGEEITISNFINELLSTLRTIDIKKMPTIDFFSAPNNSNKDIDLAMSVLVFDVCTATNYLDIVFDKKTLESEMILFSMGSIIKPQSYSDLSEEDRKTLIDGIVEFRSLKNDIKYNNSIFVSQEVLKNEPEKLLTYNLIFRQFLSLITTCDIELTKKEEDLLNQIKIIPKTGNV